MPDYALLNANDTQNMFTLFSYINGTAAEGLFWPVMLLVIWAVIVIGTLVNRGDIAKGFTYGSFVCSILAALFVLMGWLNPNYMWFAFLLTAIGAIWIKLTSGYE